MMQAFFILGWVLDSTCKLKIRFCINYINVQAFHVEILGKIWLLALAYLAQLLCVVQRG